MTQPDPAARIHAVRDSIAAKVGTLPKGDHNGRFEVDETETRYPSGLVDPTATGR